MRWIRFKDETGTTRTGRVENSIVQSGEDEFSVEDISVLPPTNPSKILGVGPNYYSNVEHYGREEPETPADLLLFVKTPPSVLVGDEDTAHLGPSGEFHFEGELGVVIGEQCQDVSRDGAMDYVKGYTCVDEITNKAVPESKYDPGNRIRSKSFDDSAPIGPVVASPDEVPPDATLEVRVNGSVEQYDVISNLIHPVPALVAEISKYCTLYPGDIIATGSPEGVDQLADGDHIEISIEGVGTLRHDVSLQEP